MNNRRRLTGVVTSNKMQKSVVVEITRRHMHPLYKKVVQTKKRIMAHDDFPVFVLFLAQVINVFYQLE